MLQKLVTQGADYATVLDTIDEDGSVPTYFLNTDVLVAYLWSGQTQTTLFSPTISWNDYTTGKVNFAEVFTALKEIGYGGPLVFETTRGRDPLETARYHMATCNFFSREASLG